MFRSHACKVTGIALALFLSPPAPRADEGMWTFNQFPAKQVAQRYGFAPDAEWLRHVRLSSLRIGRGSASFVSPEGLLLTNQHCALSCLHQLSQPGRDYLQSGFLAPELKDELRCPEVEVNQLLEIADVTGRIRTATEGKRGGEFAAALSAAQAVIQQECAAGDATTRCDVVTLHRGGRYDLYKYRRYQDVRLVFAPEYSIAFFGGDPDNFEFPRYAFDAAFLRVYVDGKPLRTKDYLPLAQQSPKPGEVLFVSGHPLATNRLLTLSQLALQRDYVQPWMATYFAELRGVLTAFSQQGTDERRAVEDMLFSVENWLKVHKGRTRELLEGSLFESKRADEQRLQTRVTEGDDPWAQIDKAVSRHRQIFDRYTLLETGYAFRSSLFDIARMLTRAAEEAEKPQQERLAEYTEASMPAIRQKVLSTAPVDIGREQLLLGWSLAKLRESLGLDDTTVRSVLGQSTPQALAAELVNGTRLGDVAFRRSLLEGGRAAVLASDDPMVRFAVRVDAAAREIRNVYQAEVDSVYLRAGARIAQIRLEEHGSEIYPDATGTLRLSYGIRKDYEDGGRSIASMTTIEQLFGRATSAPPLRLPPSWLAAKSRLDLQTPMNMAVTNDIVGGNSGSPLINHQGEIVGVIFDHNRRGFGGDYGFDGAVNRAIAVDAGLIGVALQTIYGADRLVRELRIGSSPQRR